MLNVMGLNSVYRIVHLFIVSIHLERLQHGKCTAVQLNILQLFCDIRMCVTYIFLFETVTVNQSFMKTYLPKLYNVKTKHANHSPLA